MSECSSNCSSCGQSDCASRKADFKVAQNEYSNIKNVIGVVSGKGGVGKSLVTSELAVLLSRKGYKVGVLDADITGPSIPKVFGIHEQAVGDDKGIIPAVTRGGIKVISINMLLDDEETVLLIDSWENQEAIDMHHASPMMNTIMKLREKYNLHMKVERYVSEDGIPDSDKKFIKE